MAGVVSVVTAPLPGRVANILVSVGEDVNAGQEIVALESVTMRVPVKASVAGTVKAIRTSLGDKVIRGDVLMEFV